MSKLKVINNYASNESPYKLFSSGNEFSTENKSISKSTMNPHYYYSKNKIIIIFIIAIIYINIL